MTTHRFPRVRHALRQLTSGVTALAMASVGLAGIPIIAQIAGAQPAAAGTYAPVAYVANYTAGTVSALNATTNALIQTITVGTQPSAVAISPDGTTAYVTNYGSANVTPIATGTNVAGTPIAVGTNPRGVVFSLDGTKAYVTNSTAGTVSVINPFTKTVSSTINVGTTPFGIAITPDGGKLYVAN